MSWYSHIDYIAGKLNKGLFSLRRLKDTVNTETMLLIYYAQIQSILSYGIMVWGNSSHITQLFLLQKRAVRLICNASWRAHCKPLFKNLKLLTLPSIYILSLLIHTHSKLDHFEKNCHFHEHNTRNKNSLRLQRHHYTRTQNNWRYMATKLYNHIPSHIKALEIPKFKNTLKLILIDECIY